MSATPRPTAQLIALAIAVALAGSACSSDQPSAQPATTQAPTATAAPTVTEAPTATPTPATTEAAPTTTEAPTTTVAPTTTAPPTLKEQIAASFQGVQLDVIGGAPAPGATTMFFQVGEWAAMGLWRTADSWCVSDAYDWTVTGATSPTDFTVDYVQSAVFPECPDAGDFDKEFTFHVTGVREESGRTLYDGTYTHPGGIEFPAVRTVCSATWDDPDRCGIETPGLEVPAPPAG